MMNAEPLDKQSAQAEDAPFWLKTGARVVGSIASILAIGLGVFACISISPTCILSGILQMLVGVVVALIEAPCLCMFLDFAQVPSQFFERKPYWQRALFYIIISLLPIFMCIQLATIFGCGLVLITGCLYGVLALGRKASFDEMKMRAASESNLIPTREATPQAFSPPPFSQPPAYSSPPYSQQSFPQQGGMV